MFGDIFKCGKCSLSFSTGWSHHASGSSCICGACGTEYLIRGTDEYGPGDCERFEVVRQPDDYATGVFVASLDRVEQSAHGAPLPTFDLAAVTCLECGAVGQFLLTLSEGTACPRCKEGRIEYHGAAIY